MPGGTVADLPVQAEQLIELWRRLPREGRLPRKSSLDLSLIKALLPQIAMFEVVGLDEIVWRLAGSAVLEDLEANPAWGNLIDLIAPESRAAVAALFSTAVNHPCGFIAKYTVETPSAKRIEKQTLILPLAGENRQSLFAIGLDLHSELIGFGTVSDNPRIAGELDLVAFVDLGFGTPSGAGEG